MATRTYNRPVPLDTVDPRQVAEQIRADRSWADAPSVAVTQSQLLVTHALIAPGDDAAIQAVIDAYVYEPSLQPYVFAINGAAPLTWTNMPAAMTEAPGSRTRLPLHSASYARLTCDVRTAGFAGAVLIAQVSLDGSSWVNGPQVPIGSTGLKVSGLVVLPPQYQADVHFRMVGQGGDGVVDPVFGLVTLQVA